MFGWITRALRKPAPDTDDRQPLTPDYVDALIERAGRDAVFARAESLGWTRADRPPIWVWAAIANEVIASRGTAVTLH